MKAEHHVSRLFNAAANNRFFRAVVRNAGKIVFTSYVLADTTLIGGQYLIDGTLPSGAQQAAGGLFLAIDGMFAFSDRHPKVKPAIGVTYLAAATALAMAGWDHDGRYWQMLSSLIIAGKGLGHLVQAFNFKADVYNSEKKRGFFATYPVISTVSADIAGKTMFSIGAVIGQRPDLMVAAALDFVGTLSSLGTDSSLKQIVADKDAEIRARKAAQNPSPR